MLHEEIIKFEMNSDEMNIQTILGDCAHKTIAKLNSEQNSNQFFIQVWSIMQKMEFLNTHWWLVLFSKFNNIVPIQIVHNLFQVFTISTLAHVIRQ